MEKTRCRLNICGVEVTVSGDMDRAAAERIAEAVRSRMQQVLNTAYAASIEKAAVITAMNLCEELARRRRSGRARKRPRSSRRSCGSSAARRGSARACSRPRAS